MPKVFLIYGWHGVGIGLPNTITVIKKTGSGVDSPTYEIGGVLSGKTITWSYTYTNDDFEVDAETSARMQFNQSGNSYNYVAIG